MLKMAINAPILLQQTFFLGPQIVFPFPSLNQNHSPSQKINEASQKNGANPTIGKILFILSNPKSNH